jgi:hypothetical protein
LAEPGGGPWANCAWVEVSRGRFVGGRIVKVPVEILLEYLIPKNLGWSLSLSKYVRFKGIVYKLFVLLESVKLYRTADVFLIYFDLVVLAILKI